MTHNFHFSGLFWPMFDEIAFLKKGLSFLATASQHAKSIKKQMIPMLKAWELNFFFCSLLYNVLQAQDLTLGSGP